MEKNKFLFWEVINHEFISCWNKTYTYSKQFSNYNPRKNSLYCFKIDLVCSRYKLILLIYIRGSTHVFKNRIHLQTFQILLYFSLWDLKSCVFDIHLIQKIWHFTFCSLKQFFSHQFLRRNLLCHFYPLKYIVSCFVFWFT